jgi:hypothetical protein
VILLFISVRVKAQILTSAPTAFSAKITNLDYEADDIPVYRKERQATVSSSASSSSSFLSDLLANCLPNTSCFEEDGNSVTTEASHLPKSNKPATSKTATSYTSLSENNSNLQFTYISTKKPIWNSELNQWMHFFGGRVKIPSVHNFLAIEVPPIAENFKVHYYQSAIQDQNLEKVCLRHGKIGHNTFILDFRAPVSPLIAFAIMCASHCH